MKFCSNSPSQNSRSSAEHRIIFMQRTYLYLTLWKTLVNPCFFSITVGIFVEIKPQSRAGNSTIPRIVTAIDQRRLKDAIDQLHGLVKSSLRSNLIDDLYNIETTYKTMLRYNLEGTTDPQRDEVYLHIVSISTIWLMSLPTVCCSNTRTSCFTPFARVGQCVIWVVVGRLRKPVGYARTQAYALTRRKRLVAMRCTNPCCGYSTMFGRAKSLLKKKFSCCGSLMPVHSAMGR